MPYADIHRRSKTRQTWSKPTKLSLNPKIIAIISVGILLLLFRSVRLSLPYPKGKGNPVQQAVKDPRPQIKGLINSVPNTFGIHIVDIANTYAFGINEKAVFTAASINKLPILATLYEKANHKEIDLDTVVVIQEGDLQPGAGAIAAGQLFSYKTLARLMMQKSDNTAAHVLGMILGLDKIQERTAVWGLGQTSMEENKTSAYDVSVLLTKMYRGEIAGPILTPEMLGFMSGTDFEDRIPAGVPAGIKVYHKTGDEVNQIHDVGVVEVPQKPYIIAVLSTGEVDEAETKKLIAQISKLAYESFK